MAWWRDLPGGPVLGYAAAETAAVLLSEAAEPAGGLPLCWPVAAVTAVWVLGTAGLGPRRAVAQAVVLTAVQAAALLAIGVTPTVALGDTAANLFLAGVLLAVLRMAERPIALRTTADLARLLLAAALGTAAAVLAQVVVLLAAGHPSPTTTGPLLALANGVAAFNAVALTLRLREAIWLRARPSWGRIVETICWAGLAALSIGGIYWYAPGSPAAFVVLLPAVWIAVRYSTTTSTTAIVAVGAALTLAPAFGVGSLAHLALGHQVLLAQGSAATLTVLTLSLALHRDERDAVISDLCHDSSHDALTGLANRRLFRQRLEETLGAITGRGAAGVLVLDIDDFKPVNDTWGHHEGDLLLVEVAQRLTRRARPEDTVARLGGDEFAIVCPEIGDLAELKRHARRFAAALETPYVSARGVVHPAIAASIGAATATPCSTPDQVLARADEAMYAAKRAAERSKQHDQRSAEGSRG